MKVKKEQKRKIYCGIIGTREHEKRKEVMRAKSQQRRATIAALPEHEKQTKM